MLHCKKPLYERIANRLVHTSNGSRSHRWRAVWLPLAETLRGNVAARSGPMGDHVEAAFLRWRAGHGDGNMTGFGVSAVTRRAALAMGVAGLACALAACGSSGEGEGDKVVAAAIDGAVD